MYTSCALDKQTIYRKANSLSDKEFVLCISLLIDPMEWIFCLVIRNKLIIQCKELKLSTESVTFYEALDEKRLLRVEITFTSID
jgi:hypothetical protein